jgi:hypothetical protein
VPAWVLNADCSIPVVRPLPAKKQHSRSHAGFHRPSTPLARRSHPRDSIPQIPPPLPHCSVGVLQSPNRAETRPVRSSHPECAGVVLAQSAAVVRLPRQRLLLVLVLPTTPGDDDSPGSFSPPPPSLVCVCLLVSLRTPGLPRGSRPLESSIGEPALGAVYPAARGPRSCRPTHRWRWCRTFV